MTLFSSVPAAKAATKYWEPTGSTGTNASGTWNTTGVSWTTDSTGASGPNTTFGNSTFTGTYSTGTVSATYTSTNNNQQVLADDAVFSADPAITAVSTVTLGANLGANSITFGNPGVTNGGAASGFTFAAANVLSVGSFTATGANTYTGNTAITLNAGAGPVIFNNQVNLSNGLPDAAGSSTINYSIANNSSSALTFNGLFAANTRPNNTNDTVNLTFSGTGGVTFNGVVTGNTLGASGNPGLSGEGGNLNLIINGGGAVALNAANSAVGVVSLSNGSLTLGNALAMQGLALNQTGGTFSFGTLTTANIAGLTGNTTLTLSNAAGTAGVALNDVGFNPNGTASAQNPTFSGGINGLGSLTINGVEKNGANTGGTATFSGVLSFTGANGLTINDVPAVGTGGGGGSTVVLTNANTYTGPTTVTLPGGSLTLNGNGSIAGTSAITLNGGGIVPGQTTTVGTTTLVYDNTVNGTASRLGTAPITLTGATLNYRAVTTGTGVAGTGSSGAITVGGALTSAFNFANASGTGNTSNFTIASLVNTNHGTLNATLPNANNNVGFVTLTTTPTLINGILPWTYETSNGNFLSVNASNQLNAYNNVGTDATAFNNTATSNVQLAAASTTPTAAVAENSLIVNFNGTQSLGGQALTLTSGGLVFKTATGVLGSSANDGSLTTAAANPELYVNAAATGTINSTITNSGSTAVALTKFGTGTLTLNGTNTYTGPTTVEQGTLANGGTIGALVIAPGATATLFGASTTGAVTANGTLNFPAATSAFTVGNISGTGGTGVITYANTAAAGNTLNFSGTNSFLELNNTGAAGSQLILAGPGSVNTFALFPEASAGNTTGTTTFQSGTYIFTAGGSNVGVNNLGANFNVSGANVTFANGLRFLDNGGGTVTVNSGLLQASTTNFDTNQQTSGTTVTINVKGGVLDVNQTGVNFGDEGTEAAATTDTLNVSGGIFQNGITATTGTQNITIGGSAKNNVVAAVNLSAGGTIRDNGTIASGGAPGTGSSSNFNWTGGTLTALTVNMTNLTDNDGITTSPVAGTLYNGGGILAPGYFGQALGSAVGSANAQFTGKTTITGNYQVDSTNAALAVNLGGTNATGGFGTSANQYDNVSVSGTTVLNGRLNVGLINSFAPAAGNTFNVLTSTGAISGNFDNYQVAKSGAANVIAAGGTGSFSVAVPTAAAGSVVLSNFVAGNTYTGNSTAWDAATAGSWSVYDPGSSTTLATPVASGAVAVFGNGDTTAGAATVPLNSTRNVAGILFNSTNTGATSFTIGASGNSGTIILDNTANSAAATLTDSSAAGNANAITLPIALNSPLAVSVTNATTTLTLGGTVTNTTAQAVTKTGAGTLLINGNLGSSTTSAGALTVSAGKLGGTGILTVTSATVSTGSFLAPGATIGATTGALTLNTTNGLTINGNLIIGVVGSGGTSLATNALLTLSGATLTINGSLNGTSNYDIANYGTLAAGSTFTGFTAPAGYTINYAGTSFGASDIELDVTAVPEPSTWVGAFILVLSAFGIKLRRRKAQVA